MLERWSDRDKKIPGWIQKSLAIDFIAYAYAESQTCLLLPFQLLRRAWLQNGGKWMRMAREEANGYRVIEAENKTYTTVNIAVPRSHLLSAIGDAMVITWPAA